MLISVKHHLVIMAMPKCASTSLERALKPRMDIILSGQPHVKHTRMLKYERFIRPYLKSLSNEPFEVVSLMRDPVDWLYSWWRYRSREGIPDPANSTRGVDWPTFAQAYLDGERKPADVGRQSRFLTGKDETLGADQIFRYETMDVFMDWLQGRIRGRKIELGHENVSPDRKTPPLPEHIRGALMANLAYDYEVYETLAR